MRRLFLSFLLTVSFVAMMPTLRAATPMTKITVQVMGPNDKPVDRASVIVKFVDTPETLKLKIKSHTQWQLKTQQNGKATIPSIPQGTIQVQVIAANLRTFGGLFEVHETEKTLEIKLDPPQPQYSAH